MLIKVLTASPSGESRYLRGRYFEVRKQVSKQTRSFDLHSLHSQFNPESHHPTMNFVARQVGQTTMHAGVIVMTIVTGYFSVNLHGIGKEPSVYTGQTPGISFYRFFPLQSPSTS